MPRLETRNTFFGENMEYFNGQEWKYIKDYKRGEKILTYFPKDKHVELLLPLNYIKRKSKGLNRIIFQRKLDILINDEGIFFGKYRDTGMNEYGDKIFRHDNRYMDIMTKDIPLKKSIFSHFLFINTFTYISNNSSQLTENKMELMLRSIMYGDIDKSNVCTLDMRDESIEKFEKTMKPWEVLLNKCKVRYKKDVRWRTLSFSLPRDKDVFLKSILNYSYDEIRFIVDKLDRLNDMKNKIIPKNKDSLDFIQMAYTLYGIPCHKYEDYLLKMNNLGLRTDVKDMRLFRSRYEYSFTVKTGYVVLRNNGIIMVFRDYK